MRAKSVIFLRLMQFDAKFRPNMLKTWTFLVSYLKIGTDQDLPAFFDIDAAVSDFVNLLFIVYLHS